MTRDDIIRMAREAGGDDWDLFREFMPEIKRFAKLVAAAEREACADIAENWRCNGMPRTVLADQIRQRGAP
jgi:hypothetical protein